MASNPQEAMDTDPVVGRLAGWQVLEAVGKDAGDFLQRQTMNDLQALQAVGDWQWNGLLSAKGRLLALFICLRLAQERYWLIAPDVSAVGLRDELQRFVFRSKLSLTPRPEHAARGEWRSDGPASGWHVCPPAQVDVDAAHITLPAGMGVRVLHLTAAASTDAQDIDARWRLEDLRGGLPRLPSSQLDRWTPHMLSLDRLRAFSLKKGCYPGQEIVARTHYLGRSKRQLLCLDAEQTVNIDEPIRDAEGNLIGNTICNASWHDHHSVLLVAPVDWQGQQAQASAGIRMRRRDFCDTV